VRTHKPPPNLPQLQITRKKIPSEKDHHCHLSLNALAGCGSSEAHTATASEPLPAGVDGGLPAAERLGRSPIRLGSVERVATGSLSTAQVQPD
jgi:hypothetical protein